LQAQHTVPPSLNCFLSELIRFYLILLQVDRSASRKSCCRLYIKPATCLVNTRQFTIVSSCVVTPAPPNSSRSPPLHYFDGNLLTEPVQQKRKAQVFGPRRNSCSSLRDAGIPLERQCDNTGKRMSSFYLLNEHISENYPRVSAGFVFLPHVEIRRSTRKGRLSLGRASPKPRQVVCHPFSCFFPGYYEVLP